MSQPGRPTRRKNSLPTLIEKYYADLAALAKQNVFFEMGLRQPIHALLAAAGKEHGWTLIAELEKGRPQNHAPRRHLQGRNEPLPRLLK
jgi:hypothetical protein